MVKKTVTPRTLLSNGEALHRSRDPELCLPLLPLLDQRCTVCPLTCLYDDE